MLIQGYSHSYVTFLTACLNSVVAFDILSHQSLDFSAPLPVVNGVRYDRLEFPVRNVFFVGSPVGLFDSVREAKIGL